MYYLPQVLFKLIVVIVSKSLAPLHHPLKQGLINALSLKSIYGLSSLVEMMYSDPNHHGNKLHEGVYASLLSKTHGSKTCRLWVGAFFMLSFDTPHHIQSTFKKEYIMWPLGTDSLEV